LQEKVQGSDFIKEHLMSLLRSKSLAMRQRMATSLAHLLRSEDIARAYSEHGGAAVLLDVACDADAAVAAPARWESAMAALREVVLVAKKQAKDASSSFVPDAPEKKVCHTMRAVRVLACLIVSPQCTRAGFHCRGASPPAFRAAGDHR
jgi:quinolinate synthase